MATIDDFKKLNLRIADVLEVNPHPQADRLYVLKIRVGDQEKQLVAGIRDFYSPEDLNGKKIVVVDNLDPVTLRGVESQGMLLAAKDESGLGVITVDKPINSGASVQ
jgi:methionine--tRNA ligase beta chain